MRWEELLSLKRQGDTFKRLRKEQDDTRLGFEVDYDRIIFSSAFRSLQDKTVSGFEKESNTLLGTSNGNHFAYLSFDYSENSIVKFNNLELTFSKLPPRPRLEQWFMGIY